MDGSQIEQTTDKAEKAIMELCTPDKMKPLEAIDFLERVIERCQTAIEALNEEIENS